MGTLWGLYSGTGILLGGLALPLIVGRVPPNYWYGFRTPRTLASASLWYAATATLAGACLQLVLQLLPAPKLVYGCRDLMWTLTAGCAQLWHSAR